MGEPFTAPLFQNRGKSIMKIDVIIPTYKPGEELFCLLDKLAQQSIRPNKVILMNTEKSFFKKLTAVSAGVKK